MEYRNIGVVIPPGETNGPLVLTPLKLILNECAQDVGLTNISSTIVQIAQGGSLCDELGV
jgi:hypothetical protein